MNLSSDMAGVKDLMAPKLYFNEGCLNK